MSARHFTTVSVVLLSVSTCGRAQTGLDASPAITTHAEDSTGSQNQTRLIANIGPNGKCQFARRDLVAWRNYSPTLRQLTSQLLRNEIEVLPYQDKSIRALLKAARKDAEGLALGVCKESPHQLQSTYNKQLNSILLPPQLEKLERYRNRYELLVIGVPGLLRGLDSGPIAARVREILARTKKQLRDQVVQATTGLHAKFSSVLNESQDAVMERYYVMEPILQQLPVEVWIWQLNGKKSPIGREGEQFLAMLKSGRFFELDPSGCLQSMDNLNDGLTVDFLVRDIVAAKYSQADVVSLQVREYLNLDKRDQETAKEMEKRGTEIQQAMFRGDISLDEARDKMKQLIAETERWKWERFLRVLIPDQRETLQLLIERRAILQQGWFRALASGPLADEIHLSKTQRDQIDTIRGDVYQKLVKLSRDLDDQLIRELRQVAPPQYQHQLISIKDLDSEVLPGAPEILLSQH